MIKDMSTWQAQIFCGLRKGYGEVYFSIEKVYEICQEYVDAIGWCVSITPTRFVYKEGTEEGAIVGVIQYPRFPKVEEELERRTIDLAHILLVELEQLRLSIVLPTRTITIESV